MGKADYESAIDELVHLRFQQWQTVQKSADRLGITAKTAKKWIARRGYRNTSHADHLYSTSQRERDIELLWRVHNSAEDISAYLQEPLERVISWIDNSPFLFPNYRPMLKPDLVVLNNQRPEEIDTDIPVNLIYRLRKLYKIESYSRPVVPFTKTSKGPENGTQPRSETHLEILHDNACSAVSDLLIPEGFKIESTMFLSQIATTRRIAKSNVVVSVMSPDRLDWSTVEPSLVGRVCEEASELGIEQINIYPHDWAQKKYREFVLARIRDAVDAPLDDAVDSSIGIYPADVFEAQAVVNRYALDSVSINKEDTHYSVVLRNEHGADIGAAIFTRLPNQSRLSAWQITSVAVHPRMRGQSAVSLMVDHFVSMVRPARLSGDFRANSGYETLLGGFADPVRNHSPVQAWTNGHSATAWSLLGSNRHGESSALRRKGWWRVFGSGLTTFERTR